MRTYDEIQVDVKRAHSMDDAAALRELAHELQTLGTPLAEGSALNSFGLACVLAGEYPLALEFYRRALPLFEELADHLRIAILASNIGKVFLYTGEFQSALEHFCWALAEHEEAGDHTAAAGYVNDIGRAYHNLGDYLLAMEYYRRALDMNEEIGNRNGMSVAASNIGNVYLSLGDYPSALKNYRRSLAVDEELGDREGAAYTIGSIGLVYAETGDHASALEHYGRALAMHEELGNTSGKAIVIGNMGIVFFDKGDYPSAVEHHLQALALHEEIGERSKVAHVTGNLIRSLFKDDRRDQAEELLERQALMQIDDPMVRAMHAANRATLAELNNDLDSAREHLHLALSISSQASLRDDAAMYHKSLRDLAHKRNDLAGYVEHSTEYLLITEEVRGKEATQKMAMQESERKAEAVERERDKERALLYGALPESVANRMLRGDDVSGDHYEQVSVIFLDIVNFTSLSDRIPPGHVVYLLEQIFSALDDVCAQNGVTKIKTIGDSYMAVSFPESDNQKSEMDQIERAAQTALEMMRTIKQLEITMPSEKGDTSWVKDVGEITVRIGVHCGPVTAGVIGKQRLQYDVWGDTVNVASRMESTSEPNRIHVSEQFANALSPLSDKERGLGESSRVMGESSQLILRGETEIKGKGTITTYWLAPL